jgi:hypothetical protein
MVKFKTFLLESQGKGLTMFDVDETMFITKAKVKVVKELFLDTFRQQGIDIDKIYVERAGNLGGGPAADNKKVIFRKYLDKKIYKRIRLFDDAKSNLKAFLSLQKDYPEVSFEAYHAKSNGSVNRVR